MKRTIRQCAECGESYEPQRSTQLYCSGRCRLIAFRRRTAVDGERDEDTSHYIRCPLCGKNSRPDSFHKGEQWGHDLETSTATALSRPGHRGGFDWVFRPMSRGIVAILAKHAQSVADRLRAVHAMLDDTDDTAEVAERMASAIASAESPDERRRLERIATDVGEILEGKERRNKTEDQ